MLEFLTHVQVRGCMLSWVKQSSLCSSAGVMFLCVGCACASFHRGSPEGLRGQHLPGEDCIRVYLLVRLMAMAGSCPTAGACHVVCSFMRGRVSPPLGVPCVGTVGSQQGPLAVRLRDLVARLQVLHIGIELWIGVVLLNTRRPETLTVWCAWERVPVVHTVLSVGDSSTHAPPASLGRWVVGWRSGHFM
jgi:hypothetical protein